MLKSLLSLLLWVCLARTAVLAVAQETSLSPTIRFGMEVEVRPLGVVITELSPDRPIAHKLKEGDILSAYTILIGRDQRTVRIEGPESIDFLKQEVAEGRTVQLRVLRPELGQGRFQEVVVAVEALDLLLPPSVDMQESYSVTALTASENANVVRVSVFYGTDRKLEPGRKYSGERDRGPQPIKYGVCQVTIPPDHRISQLEGPKFWKFDFTTDPRKHVYLSNVSQIGKDVSWAAITGHFQALPGDGTNRVLVFVHGYNVSFVDAARRTGQMHYDLAFPGVSMFFSWPSDGTVTGYLSDTEDIVWSTPHIESFLEELEHKSDVHEVYVIAHSMGNRGVTRALQSLASKNKGKKIKEIMLAAADVDSDVFERDIAPVLSSYYERTTIYASEKDEALKASRTFNGQDRLGAIKNGLPTVKAFPRLDLVDASSVKTDFVDHSYYGDSESVISDIFRIVRLREPPPRANLIPVQGALGAFWKLP